MRPSVFEADLPRLAYMDAENPEDAHRRIRQAREQSPIAIGLLGPEVLSYELVRTVLFDGRFSVAQGLMLAAQGVTSDRLKERVRNTLMSLDGAEHRRMRRLAAQAFGPRSAARLVTVITDVISSLIDPVVEAGSGDVVDEIAQRYPSPVLGAFLGAPEQDWRLFAGWSEDISWMFTGQAAAKQDAIMTAYDELDAYIADMVAARRDNPTDDVISELIRTHDGDRLTHRDLCMLVSGLLIAGTDTIRNQLAAAVQVLCDHPEQWALLGDHPELAPQAVAELLRHTPAAVFVVRQAVEDVELGGVVIPAGTRVVVNTAAANRDPDVYEDPERLDITRETGSPMLTFGAGARNCLGAHLARTELAQALILMTRRMRNPRRTGPAPWKPFAQLTGPATLPIEFDPTST
ncbi:cytochrome P450 [Mycobacterium camsae]|uniref:cytochrome P450 n=1 Tax=Mycobacterium gordonae TaxID=1778 RepID=UPI00197FF2A0|nr:cytochrome P450 [Mycobacterium gordonae]